MSTEQRLVLSRLQSDQPDVQGAGTSVEISASDCPVLLGRGPLLQIADTRVSRKQGQIEWMGHAEQWRLVSNKSMLIAPANDQGWKTLEAGQSEVMENGCSIGFIDTNTLTFKVSLGPIVKSIQEAATDETQSTSACESQPKAKKERVLPSWMKKYSKDVKEDAGTEESGNQASQPSTSKTFLPKKDGPESSTDIVAPPPDSIKHNLSDSDDDEPPRLASNRADGQASSEQPVTTGPVADDPGSPRPHRRSSCPFGSGCYRKNPQHRQDEAHPGDDDYKDPAAVDAEDEDKPECEYGTDCYRQNPQHRRDYRHTVKPRPPKRKAAKKAKDKAAKKRKAAGSDEDDYDSSFIDDDEELSDERDLTSEEEEEWKPEDDDSN